MSFVKWHYHFWWQSIQNYGSTRSQKSLRTFRSRPQRNRFHQNVRTIRFRFQGTFFEVNPYPISKMNSKEIERKIVQEWVFLSLAWVFLSLLHMYVVCTCTLDNAICSSWTYRRHRIYISWQFIFLIGKVNPIIKRPVLSAAFFYCFLSCSGSITVEFSFHAWGDLGTVFMNI